MYFPLGYRNEFKNDDEIQYIDNISTMVCILSSNTINLWTCGSQGFKLVLKENNDNIGKKFIWKPNDLYLLIEGKDNESAYFFKIIIGKFRQFSLKQLNYKKFEEFGHFSCFKSVDKDTILVGTKSGYMVFLNWKGDIIQGISLDFLRLKNENEKGIIDIQYSNGIYVIILENGSLNVLSKKSTSSNFFEFDILFTEENIFAISCSIYEDLICVGTLSGDVLIFKNLKFLKKIKNESITTSGSSSIVKFSPDGKEIAVGYSKRGLKVFHVLFESNSLSTIPKFSKNNLNEPFKNGIQSLSWDTNGFNLIVSEKNSSTFSVYQFSKLYDSNNKSTNIILYGSNSIYVMNEKLNFNIFKIPNEYISENFPITNISVSDNEDLIAVSGRKGCIIYQISTGKWRVFGDKNQESLIRCIHLFWINNSIGIIHFDKNENKSEIYIYPFNHLDYSSLIHHEILFNGKIKSSSFYLNTILFYDENNQIHIYKILFENENVSKLIKYSIISFKQKIRKFINVSTIIRLNTISGKVLILFEDLKLKLLDFQKYKQKEEEFELIKNNVELFWVESKRNEGCLYFTFNQINGIEVYFDTFKDLKIESNIIQFDNSNSFPVGILKNEGLFLVSSLTNKLRLGNNFNEIITEKISPYDQIIFIYFLNEMINDEKMGESMSIIHEKMNKNDDISTKEIIMNNDATTNKKNNDNISTNKKNEHIYQNDSFKKLIQFSKKIEYKSSFIASLEWLLNTILINDDSNQFYIIIKNEKKKINSDLVLPKIILFLKEFKQYPAILINCLRKTDISLWSKLFKLIGDPKDLFSDWLKKNYLNETGYLLRILQQTEGISYAYSSSFLVLEEILKSNQFDISNDLIRFINTLEIEIEEKEKKKSIIDGFLNDNFILQSMILKKSKETLLEGNLNLLRNISLNFDLNIETWLSIEDDNDISISKQSSDWIILFDNMLNSFNIPNKKQPKNILNLSNISNHQFFTNTQEYVHHSQSLYDYIILHYYLQPFYVMLRISFLF
eukprot:gene4233-7570_t